MFIEVECGGKGGNSYKQTNSDTVKRKRDTNEMEERCESERAERREKRMYRGERFSSEKDLSNRVELRGRRQRGGRESGFRRGIRKRSIDLLLFLGIPDRSMTRLTISHTRKSQLGSTEE